MGAIARKPGSWSTLEIRGCIRRHIRSGSEELAAAIEICVEGVRLPFHLLETARNLDDGDLEKKILERAAHKLRTGVLIDGHPPDREASTDSDGSVTDVGSSEPRATGPARAALLSGS